MQTSNTNRDNARLSGILTLLNVMLVMYIILYYGLFSIEQKNRDFQLSEFSTTALKLVDEGKIAANHKIFWCLKLNYEIYSFTSPKAFLERIVELRKLTGEPLPCLIWGQDLKVFHNDYFPATTVSDRNFTTFLDDMKQSFDLAWKMPESVSQRLKYILGPQFTPRKIYDSAQVKTPNFVITDSAGKFPEFWINSSSGFLVMVFFNRNKRVPESGLIHFQDKYKNSDLGIKIVSSHEKSVSKNRLFLFNALNKLKSEGRFSGISDQIMVAGKKISDQKTLVVYKPYRPLADPGKLSLLIALSCFFLLSIFLKQAGEDQKMANFSIRWQLMILLFTTTGLPLIALGLVASDHLQQKRLALIKKAHQTCVDFVQHIDQRSVIMLSSLINDANKAIEEIRKHLPGNFASQTVVNEIRNCMGRSFTDLRIISSEPAVILTENGFYQDKKFHFFNKDKGKTDQRNIIEAKVFKEIGSYYLSVLNNHPFKLENLTETELLAEMVYQRPLHEILQNLMLATDKILTMGWGAKPFPVLLKMISLKDKSINDYFYLTLFDELNIQKDFLTKQLQNIERNPFDLKIIICNNWNFFPDNRLIGADPWFNELYKKVGAHPSSEPEFTNYNGQECVYAGIKAQNLNIFNFFAFYPLEIIDKQIAEEKHFLISAGLVVLLMLAGLALMFSSGLVTPLSALQTGAIALKERNFNFRLPPLTKDEFGEMAKIFNSSMADFEELSLASIVQTRLFPQSGIENKSFRIYGRTIPMAELGGDYFDYFKIDETHFAMLLGDVAGHGVGASLIMAMAKAGIMYCEKKLDDPAAVLTSLHQLIHETRTKTQRKVMTFQYLYFDSETGRAIYSNAGACSPILVDPTAKAAEEVTLHAPVLGGFKKSTFSNLDLLIKPGQALIFYTDGIVETQNPAGIEIGYDGLKEILLASFASDPKTYYENIYSRYLQWLGVGNAQDDLTIIILVR